MIFHIHDFSEYTEAVLLTSADYENDCWIDISDCWDNESETWDEDEMKAKAEAEVKSMYGADAMVDWEYL